MKKNYVVIAVCILGIVAIVIYNFYPRKNNKEEKEKFTVGYVISDIPVDTIKMYSLNCQEIKNKYAVPAKWKKFLEEEKISKDSNYVYYFKNDNEEMYIVNYSTGYSEIVKVYNPKMNPHKWVGSSAFEENIKNAILKRFRNEVLKDVKDQQEKKCVLK